MPGRASIGQTGFLPDGRHFACIHADRRWLYFAEVVDGFSHISALDVLELVDLDAYWS